MLNHLPAAISLAGLLSISACGSGSDGGGTGASVPPRQSFSGADQDVAADQALADAARLMLSDFPVGWSEVPAKDDEATIKVQRRIAECLGSNEVGVIGTAALARTGNFTNPDDESIVGETVGLAASVDDAVAVVAGFRGPDVPSCFAAVYTEFVSKEGDLPDGAELGEITVARLNVTAAGDEVAALRVTVPITVSGIELSLVADQVLLRTGRSLAGLSFQSQQQPTAIGVIDEYVAIAAGRLPG